MLEKPNIPDQLIISHLQKEYAVLLTELTFLPIGADEGSAVYRAVTDHGAAYFLKLRRHFDEMIVRVPLFLREQGVKAVIVPFETKFKRYWADFGEYKMILYPFVEGKDGFDRELSDDHRRKLGAALKAIHSAPLSPELAQRIPKEIFSGYWRELLKTFQRQVENQAFGDPTAARLVDLMKSKREEIDRLIARAQALASKLQAQPVQTVLCHSDIHGGNILIGEDDELYIVDWDNPILAPKERDLMFIGGGIDRIWESQRDEAAFYEGYGDADINWIALAYYRYERIIEDLVVICEQLLSTDEGGADRERSYGWFTSNFEPGGTIEIAEKTDGSLS